MEWLQWFVSAVLAGFLMALGWLVWVQARRIEMLEDWRKNQEWKAERERGRE